MLVVYVLSMLVLSSVLVLLWGEGLSHVVVFCLWWLSVGLALAGWERWIFLPCYASMYVVMFCGVVLP
jgi:hypothetical protein